MASKKTGSAIVKWDEQLAKEAEVAAAQEANTGGGRFISIRGGVLTVAGAPVPGNAMAVVIADSVFENAAYEGDFDADNVKSPVCFAFGRDEKTMTPHELSQDKKNEDCASCLLNRFGSAEKGRGKACKNIRRLGLLSAGTLNNGKFKLYEPDYWDKAEPMYFKLPVTSVQGYAAYVKQVAAALQRPPHGIVSKLSLQPDPKSQFKVVIEPLIKLPDNLMPAIMAKRESIKKDIEFPYQPAAEDEAPRGRAKGKKSKRY